MPCKLIKPADRVKQAEATVGRKLTRAERATVVAGPPTFSCTPGRKKPKIIKP